MRSAWIALLLALASCALAGESATLLRSSDPAQVAQGLALARTAAPEELPSLLSLAAGSTPIERKLGEEAVARVLARCSAPGEEELRQRAEAALLAHLRAGGVAPGLTIRGLGLVGHCPSARALASYARANPTRDAALWSLERISCPTAVAVLNGLVCDSRARDAGRIGAANALGAKGAPEAVPALLGVVRKAEGSEPVLIACLDALGVLGDLRGVPATLWALRFGGPGLRPSAVGATLRLADANAAEFPVVARGLYGWAQAAATTDGQRLAAETGLAGLPPR